MLNLKVSYELADDDKLNAKLQHVLQRAMFKMEELAVQKAPFDQGELREKISVYPKGLANNYTLTSRAQHSENMEYGSEPFYAPIDDLIGWARRKGKDEDFAYAVRHKIAEKGVKAQPFLRPSFLQVKDYWLNIFMAEEFSSQTKLPNFL